MALAMDHLVVALLNTALEDPDPLETALGAARWWSGIVPSPGLPLVAGKPRFDGALAEALRHLRGDVAGLVSGSSAGIAPRFRSDGADVILFGVLHAACAAVHDGSLKRVRRCTRQACSRYFFDETKNGSRRWCSLRCMERARAPRRRTISR
jgi:predicted RNA-binding Zn ribbon-like protein